MSMGFPRYAAQHPKLRDASGHELPGLFREAARPSSRALIVAHDVFGLTPQIRGVVGRLAGDGYVVFAPDLYRGAVATTEAEGAALASKLGWNRVAVELGLAVAALKQRSEGMRVAVLGFAMGGAAALVAAAALDQLDAAVTFCGIPQDVRVEGSAVRVLGHFATRDARCTPARVEALGDMLERGKIASELHTYEADAGFFDPSRPAVHAPAHAASAWARTMQFLEGALA